MAPTGLVANRGAKVMIKDVEMFIKAYRDDIISCTRLSSSLFVALFLRPLVCQW